MSPRDFRRLIDYLGITQRGAANLLSVDERTVRRWLAGERDMPPVVARFLAFIVQQGVEPGDVMEILAKPIVLDEPITL